MPDCTRDEARKSVTVYKEMIYLSDVDEYLRLAIDTVAGELFISRSITGRSFLRAM